MTTQQKAELAIAEQNADKLGTIVKDIFMANQLSAEIVTIKRDYDREIETYRGTAGYNELYWKSGAFYWLKNIYERQAKVLNGGTTQSEPARPASGSRQYVPAPPPAPAATLSSTNAGTGDDVQDMRNILGKLKQAENSMLFPTSAEYENLYRQAGTITRSTKITGFANEITVARLDDTIKESALVRKAEANRAEVIAMLSKAIARKGEKEENTLSVSDALDGLRKAKDENVAEAVKVFKAAVDKRLVSAHKDVSAAWTRTWKAFEKATADLDGFDLVLEVEDYVGAFESFLTQNKIS